MSKQGAGIGLSLWQGRAGKVKDTGEAGPSRSSPMIWAEAQGPQGLEPPFQVSQVGGGSRASGPPHCSWLWLPQGGTPAAGRAHVLPGRVADDRHSHHSPDRLSPPPRCHQIEQMFIAFPPDVTGHLDYKNLVHIITHGEEKD